MKQRARNTRPTLNILTLLPSTIQMEGNWVDILVDGKPIADFSRVLGCLFDLYHSLDQSGRYDLVTCTCGLPECARIRPAKVGLTKDYVKWTIFDPVPGSFVFDKRAYAKEIARAIDEQGGLFWRDIRVA